LNDKDDSGGTKIVEEFGSAETIDGIKIVKEDENEFNSSSSSISNDNDDDDTDDSIDSESVDTIETFTDTDDENENGDHYDDNDDVNLNPSVFINQRTIKNYENFYNPASQSELF
jgi:hypothetical protein